MLIALLTLPLPIGLSITIVCFTVLGLAVFYVGHLLTRTWEESDPSASNRLSDSMFRIGGTLLALLLSLTFADLRMEHATSRTAIELESRAILDTYTDLGFLGTEKARDIQAQLLNFTQRVVEVEWPQLVLEGLDSDTTRALKDIQSGVHDLEATTTAQTSLRANLIRDVREISNHRHHRAFKASPQPPLFIYVEIAGFLITMMMLSVYSPIRKQLALMILYCGFIGIVIFAMFASTSPFHGPMKLSSEPLMQAYEQMLLARPMEG